MFDIEQGVAISIFVKRSDSSKAPAEVYHYDRYGPRSGSPSAKYEWLDNHHLENTPWTKLMPTEPQYLFVPQNTKYAKQYADGWHLLDIFSAPDRPAPGLITTHDEFAISWDRDATVSKMIRFLRTKDEAEARRSWSLCTTNQWNYNNAKKELQSATWRDDIEPIMVGPFDIRSTIYNRHVTVHRRHERLSQHLLPGDNLGLITCKQQSQKNTWNRIGVTRTLTESGAISRKTKRLIISSLSFCTHPSDLAHSQ